MSKADMKRAQPVREEWQERATASADASQDEGIALAPAKPAATFAVAADAERFRAPVHLESAPRKKTWGEKIFNLFNYGVS